MNQLEKICLTGLVALPLGITTIAFGLLKTPTLSSCQTVENPTTTTQLYCAEQKAQRGTPGDLAAAIHRLKAIAMDDPYRQQSDRFIQQWSGEILTQAEAEVQAGNLDRGIEIAQLLAQDAKIQSWRSLWKKGDALIETALNQIEKQEWKQAFETAEKLQQLENPYWATEQYNSLIKQIQRDRELRDATLKNKITASTTELELSRPEPENVVFAARSMKGAYSDLPMSRSVVEQPQLQTEPVVQSPSELSTPGIPAPEKNDRT